jgi:flagellin-like hook-associated protein FlgL
MSLILDGTSGLSDVDGTAATPAIRGTDTNTGIFFGSDIIGFSEGGTECARFNADAQFVASAGTASLPVITTNGDLNTGIFFPAADTIAFSEGGVESMRVNSNGSLLIGNTAQNGSESFGITRPANTTTYIHMLKSTQVECTWGFKSSTDSNMYIGSGSSAVGTFGVFLTNTGSSWSAVSDERQKNIIESIDNALEKIITLRTVIGSYKNDNKNIRRPFLIAQDVQKILPEAVSISDQETQTLGMSYTDIIPLLVASIKELKTELDSVKSELSTLKGAA